MGPFFFEVPVPSNEEVDGTRNRLIAIVVAVVWQAHRDDQTMKLVRAWGNSSMIWLSAALGATQRESEAAAEPSKLSDQATSTPAVTSTPTKEFTDLNQQLQTVVNDLAVLRRNVEQLSERQEQMSRDISTVQAIEQNVSEKISSLTQAPPVHVPPRKNVPRLVHAETPRQPTAASGQSQPSTVGTASPTVQPPRPPMPLPTPAETSSPLHAPTGRRAGDRKSEAGSWNTATITERQSHSRCAAIQAAIKTIIADPVARSTEPSHPAA